MYLAALALLFPLVILFTAIQTFYLEGMRLRKVELPALQYFKAEFEPRLGMRSEEGSLSFSLWKHGCLVLFGVLSLAQWTDGETPNFPVLLEAMGSALFAMLLCAYLIPQILFRRTGGNWLNPLLGFYRAAALLVRPLVLGLGFLHSLLDIVKQEPEDEDGATVAENIDALITAGAEEGLIEEEDRKLIQSVVAFGDKTVREIMTPRPNMVSVQADETLEDLHAVVVNEQYSRIPVWQSSIDEVIGFVHVRDMFEVAESSRKTRKVRELMRPIRFVPETKAADDLMREMQQEGAHMAIVVDEYGNTAGLVTMEDLVEVILGEIRDEHEPHSDVTDDGKGGYIVSGNFDLSRVHDLLEFRPEEDIESTTVGGLVMEWLGRVPKAGEDISRDGICIEVLASDEMRVEKVRLSRKAAEAGPVTDVISEEGQ